MRLIFVTLVAVLAHATAAAASHQDPAFFADKWDTYDGSERLGLLQEQCDQDGWPNGYTARQASEILKGVSKADGQRLMKSCDPKELAGFAGKERPVAAKRAAIKPKVLNVKRPELHRIEHPFATVSKDKQYRCWIDANGRHRVGEDDPQGTGWCFGRAVGDSDG
jgi:hypothetical protein